MEKTCCDGKYFESVYDEENGCQILVPLHAMYCPVCGARGGEHHDGNLTTAKTLEEWRANV